MSENGIRVEYEVHFKRDRRARKILRQGPAPEKVPDAVPRIARLLALAWKWECMVQRGEVKDYAEIARQMGLTRVRVTQVIAMTLLAPDLQELVLLTPAAARGHSIAEHRLRDVAGETRWDLQRLLFTIPEQIQRSGPRATSP